MDNATGQTDAQGESILPKLWMDAREWTSRHGPLPKRLWCQGVFWGNTTGQLVVKRSTESLIRGSFTLHFHLYRWPAM